MTNISELDVTSGVVVFSSDFCPFCIRAKRLLHDKNVQFREFRVDGAPTLRAQMAELAGKKSVPQIWINGDHIGGCDDLFALEQQGKLESLLTNI